MSLIYLGVPALIFFIGYLRYTVGIPLALILLICGVLAVARCGEGVFDADIPLRYIIAFACFSVVFSWFSGVGEFIYSLNDHPFRVATLNDLVDYDWPVIYDYSTQQNPEVIEFLGKSSGKTAFIYYFSYFLPAALAGKLFGITAARVTLLIWNAFGIFLCLLGGSKIAGKASAAVPFMFVFYGGLDIIPAAVHAFYRYPGWTSLEGWVQDMYYYCNMSNLANGFNQTVPLFLVTALILTAGDVKSIGLPGALLFAYSPFGIFGIFPVILTMVIKKKMCTGGGRRLLTDIMNPVNTVPAVILLVVYGTFYTMKNAMSERGFTWIFYDNKARYVLCYLLFILLEVLIPAGVLFKRYRKDAFYICAVISLCVIPFYLMSPANDFCTKSALPSQFILSMYFAGYLTELYDEDRIYASKREKAPRRTNLKKVFASLVLVLMMFPSFVNVFLIAGSELTGEPSEAGLIGSFGNLSTDRYVDLVNKQHFADDYEDTLFFKYFAV